MTEMMESDIRVYPRKIFRCRAKLAIETGPALDAWIGDVSLDGISLMLASPVNLGQYCVIKFETEIKGSMRQFSAIARSVYSVCSSAAQYRTGFQFSDLSPACVAIINDLEG